MGLLVRLSLAFLVVSLTGAEAQTGRYSHGHSKYHHAYKGLMRPDAPTSSCCNDNDCRPTDAKFNVATGNWEAVKDGAIRPSAGRIASATAPSSDVCLSLLRWAHLLRWCGGFPTFYSSALEQSSWQSS